MDLANHRLKFYCLILVLTLCPAQLHAAGTDCDGTNIRDATAQARNALTSGSQTQRDTALVCLLAATEALDRKFDDLIAGRIPFTGPVTAEAFYYSGGRLRERAKSYAKALANDILR